MFLGHFGIAFGAKAAAPKVSLGTLILAAQFIDLIWPTLVLLGIERVNIISDGSRYPPLDFVYYPYSHSLLMVAGWAHEAKKDDVARRYLDRAEKIAPGFPPVKEMRRILGGTR